MLKMVNKITVNEGKANELIINVVNSITINSTYDKFTDTAEILFPENINFNGKNIFTGRDALIKRNDSIKIELGYDTLKPIFKGYITKVGSSNPIKIECEDQMFLLKKVIVTHPDPSDVKVITKSKTGRALKKPINITEPILLSQLLDHIIPDEINYKIIVSNSTGSGTTDDVNLGSFVATKVSVTEILNTLKDVYGLYSYFKDDVLFVGLPNDASDSKTENFTFEENIIDGTTLEYQQADDIHTKVVAISMNEDNTKKQIEVGDKDGSQRTYYTYNANEEELKIFANAKLNEVKYTGYFGKFKTFGEPYVRHGDIAKITSKKFSEQDGFYQIVGVQYNWDTSEGYTRDIDIGQFLGKSLS